MTIEATGSVARFRKLPGQLENSPATWNQTKFRRYSNAASTFRDGSRKNQVEQQHLTSSEGWRLSCTEVRSANRDPKLLVLSLWWCGAGPAWDASHDDSVWQHVFESVRLACAPPKDFSQEDRLQNRLGGHGGALS